jgi:hypothetical protein
MSDVLSPKRIAEIGRMLMKMNSVLRRFEYVTMGGASADIVERGENWPLETSLSHAAHEGVR